MKDLFSDSLNRIYQKKSGKAFIRILVFVLILAPVILIIIFSYTSTKKHLTEAALQSRQTVASLAAYSLEANFKNAQNIAVSLAGRPQLSNLIEQSKWNDAVKILDGVTLEFPFIERVFLSDLEGTLMSDLPMITDTHGKNFAYRDWYKGVSKDWKPYFSEAYKRSAQPQYNVVAVAVPIKQDQKLLGILVVQMRLDTLLEWSRNVDFGKDGFIYYVDKSGHVAAHPQFAPQGEIPDFSSKIFVQKALAGQSGMENVKGDGKNKDHLVTLEPVPGFGWGVFFEQPVDAVFAQRDDILRVNAIMYSIVILIDLLFALFVIYFLRLVGEKRILEKLEGELFKFKLALDNTSDHVIITDTNGIILYANKAAEKLTGYSRDEIIGNRPSLWGNKMPKEFYEKMWKTIKEEKTTFEASIKNRRKNGEEYEASIKISPVLDSAGALLFFVGLERDVTREKLVDRAKSEFVSVASHQLRTPLGISKWYLEALQKENYIVTAPENIQNYFSQLVNNNERVLSLVRELLSVSRIEQGRVKDNPKMVDIGELIGETIKELLPLAQNKKIELKFKIKQQKIQNMLIDALRLHEVIENLISNSIEYTPTAGKIDVTLDKNSDEGLIIDIKDTGIGISSTDQEKLFTKFFRSQKAISNNPEGSGLGLYIAKFYVEGWGGTISVKSSEGKGTTITISIPFTKAREASMAGNS